MKKGILIFILFIVSVFAFSQITLVDDIGRVLTLDKPVSRIVSAAPAVSDYLKHLNLKDSVVGVTDWDSSFPSIEKIGNLVPLNMEKIISLDPDIVFISGGFQESEISKLEKYNIPVFVINPLNLNDIFKDTVKIGILTGKTDEAQILAKTLREKMLTIAKTSFTWKNKHTIFYAMLSENLAEIWTTGTGSYMNELLAYAGGYNIAAMYTGNNGWLSLGAEFLLENDPDIIILPSYYPGDAYALNILKNADQLKELKAVKNKNIILIDGNKASQASPSVFDVLEDLYKKLGEIK